MRVWIDATSSHNELLVFGMSMLERQLRTIQQANITPTAIYIQLPPGTTPPPWLPEDLTRALPLHWVRGEGTLQDGLAQAVQAAKDEPVLAFAADTIIDTRLMQYLASQSGALVVYGGDEGTRTALLRLEGQSPSGDLPTTQLTDLAESGVRGGLLRVVALADVPTYIKKLRRDFPAYLFRVTNEAQRREAEHFLFWSNYKGSTDFFTKYVYPPLVWRMVRPLARWRVHPNVVTLVSIILTFLAVPLFARKYWFAGFLCSYGMSVLDSVDGKLARLTFSASRLGDILDHGLDQVHPPLWYFGWAWALSDGDPTSTVWQAAWWMVVFYVIDRLVAAFFNYRNGRSIHGFTPLDVQMRTFISRRNINLPLFTVGLILGVPVQTFMFIVLWQLATLIFHIQRLVKFWNGRETVEAAG